MIDHCQVIIWFWSGVYLPDVQAYPGLIKLILMRKTIFTFVLSFIFPPDMPMASELTYLTFQKPIAILESELDDFNIFINQLEALTNSYGQGPPSYYELSFANGELIADFASELHLKTSSTEGKGVLKVPGSIEKRQLALVEIKSNLQQKVDGVDLNANFEKGTLVLVARELKDWKFVTDVYWSEFSGHGFRVRSVSHAATFSARYFS